jgi:hypothetical protein
MDARQPSGSRGQRVFRALAISPTAIWSAFILVHLWLGFVNLTVAGAPLGDVQNQYTLWAEFAVELQYYEGINAPWVYPVFAMVPIVMSFAFGAKDYAATWLSLVLILDIVAFAVLVGWRRPGRPIAIGWWWIAFLFVLGPIAMGRLDSVSVALAIVGVLIVAARPRSAAVLLTIATWIKVWPAALIAAIIVSSRARGRFLVRVIVTSVTIIAFALVLGSGANVFSFVTQETGRGLEVESPVSTVWMWLSFVKVSGATPYFSQQIDAYEVTGPGASAAAAVMPVILATAVLAIVLIGIFAVRRGTAVTELLPPLALALVTAFIVFNKVGSPQYMTWIAVPVILGLATNAAGHGTSFRTPALLALLAAALTQAFYPYFFEDLIRLNPLMLLALSARNLVVMGILVWAIVRLVALFGSGADHQVLIPSREWLPSAWPFTTRERPSTTATTDAAETPSELR